MEKKYILDKETTARNLKRLAFEIVERNHDEHQLFFAAIRQSGLTVAKLLAAEVMNISNIKRLRPDIFGVNAGGAVLVDQRALGTALVGVSERVQPLADQAWKFAQLAGA